MSVFSITNNIYHEEVVTSGKPVLLDFWAPWCGPCKKLSPVVDKIAEENPHIKVGKVNVEEQKELAEKFHIMSIPALILMKEGKAVATSVGVKPQAAIEQMFNS